MGNGQGLEKIRIISRTNNSRINRKYLFDLDFASLLQEAKHFRFP